MNRAALFVLGCLLSVHPKLTAQDPGEEFIRTLDRGFTAARMTEPQIVASCRVHILDCVRFGEGDVIRALLNYLDRRITNPWVLTLWPGEQFLLSFWAEDYAPMLDMNHLEHLDEADFSGFVEPPPDSLFELLCRYSIERRDLLRMQISSSRITRQQEEFLSLFLDYLLISSAGAVDDSAVNRSADLFLLRYPGSPYAGYVRRQIRLVLKESDYGHALDVGIGAGSFSGRLATLFTDPGMGPTLGYDFRWRRFFGSREAMLSLRVFAGLSGRVQSPFTYHKYWEDRLRLNVFIPELSVGLAATDNGTIRTTPFAGLSALLISSAHEEAQSTGNDVSLNLLTYTVGINIDWSLSTSNVNTEGMIGTSWYLRTRLTFHAPITAPEMRFGGSMVTLTVSVGSVGRILVHDL